MSGSGSSFVLREVNGIRFYEIPAFSERGRARAAFSTRDGGIAADPESRTRFYRALGLDRSEVVTAHQVHGDRVLVVGGAAGLDPDMVQREDADALVTDRPGLGLGGYFADCVPLFFHDPRRGIVGLAHGGWRGTVLRIGAKTLRAMVETYGCRPEDCLVAIGPSIGPCCYEVGEEVAVAAQAAFPGWKELLVPRGDGKWIFDLWQANHLPLLDAGVREENILVAGLCTCCRRDEFFSHRGERGRAGRMGALIVLSTEGEGLSSLPENT